MKCLSGVDVWVINVYFWKMMFEGLCVEFEICEIWYNCLKGDLKMNLIDID